MYSMRTCACTVHAPGMKLDYVMRRTYNSFFGPFLVTSRAIPHGVPRRQWWAGAPHAASYGPVLAATTAFIPCINNMPACLHAARGRSFILYDLSSTAFQHGIIILSVRSGDRVSGEVP